MKKFVHGCLPVLLTLGFTLFLTIRSEAQYEDELEDITGHYEAGLTIGENAFFGDLGGTRGIGRPFVKDFNSPTTRPLVGGFINYFYYSWLSVKFSLNYTNVDGADSLIKNTGDAERWRYYRNLSFRSRIFEGSLSADIYPVMMFDHDVEIHKIAPYVGLGLGLFHFNPQTFYDGQWVNLKPLHTEGEGFSGIDTSNGKPFPKNYHRLQLYIPLTVGLKVYFTNKIAMSVGITFRHTFTDYIDDVSGYYVDPSLFSKYLSPSQAILAQQLYQRSLTPWKVRAGIARGDKSQNDSYTTMFLTLSIRFGGGPKFYYGG